ncbi:hypothetical protein [Arenibacter certesii]|uniref:Uncharacterized protein n=1 Tax=Arenibacter certesii TaxID=228955 RepID=A0A918ML85_9FLAO|nr:hypothetical protein [Arenibacter certesii]GGW37246.1 hypothetical protein GCM10007383_22630 [Arenibacter certesii]
MDNTSEFDYTQLSKSELGELYHKIIDAALENNGYKLHVLQKWNISQEEFHRRSLASIAIRKREKDRKLEVKKVVLEYLRKRYETMSNEDAEREWKHLKAEVEYRNPN